MATLTTIITVNILHTLILADFREHRKEKENQFQKIKVRSEKKVKINSLRKLYIRFPGNESH